MHVNIIALDLKVARRKAGLLQSDLAHLLAVQSSRISLFESGKALPSLWEIAALSLVYGKPIESLLSGVRDDVADNLIGHLATLPPITSERAESFNRAHTLSQLAIHLEALIKARDAA